MQELNMKNSLDANLVQMSANYWMVYVAFSTALFYRLSTHFLPMYIPFSVVEKNKQWMFKNICNSLLHSSISSIWIAFCLWNYPAHRHDLINVYSNQAYLLICFSVGYFLYDFLDMYWNDRENSFHLLVHHLVVIGVFGVALYSRFYLGYAMSGLLVEVNSVFLHVRTLMRLSGRAQSSPGLHRGVCVMNFVTFIIFRIYLLAYLTHWLFSNRAYLNPNLFLFTLPCLVTINVMSWLLLVKITVEDFAHHLIYAGHLMGCGHLVKHLEDELALAERGRKSDDNVAEGGDGGKKLDVADFARDEIVGGKSSQVGPPCETVRLSARENRSDVGGSEIAKDERDDSVEDDSFEKIDLCDEELKETATSGEGNFVGDGKKDLEGDRERGKFVRSKEFSPSIVNRLFSSGPRGGEFSSSESCGSVTAEHDLVESKEKAL